MNFTVNDQTERGLLGVAVPTTYQTHRPAQQYPHVVIFKQL